MKPLNHIQMKVLHTSDWHLGQKFLYRDREKEHILALEWLCKAIAEEQVDILIVAGDIFDIGNPPNYARKLYYQFLTRLLDPKIKCKQVIIIGGNHDSPTMLDAPKELLMALNVYVVGSVTGDHKDEIIELKGENGELMAVIGAVPFLRDRDLKYSISGEGGEDRIARIKTGILKHYKSIAERLKKYQGRNIPILTTGHLFATGAESSEKQDNIYIGDKENIKADQFPSIFDYVALGHIHRAQSVGGQNHIRYSGSLIPLSFSETKDDKSVYLLHFEGKKLKKIETLEVPQFRRLKTIKGNLEKIEADLRKFAERNNRMLIPWIEVILETEQLIPQIDVRLKTLAEKLGLEILKIRIERKYQNLETQLQLPDLDDLEVLEVFQKKCTSFGSPPEEMKELILTFKELQDWLQEKEA